MDRSWASRRVGRKGERRVEERGGRMVDAGAVDCGLLAAGGHCGGGGGGGDEVGRGRSRWFVVGAT
jgi:hypothetical protein